MKANYKDFIMEQLKKYEYDDPIYIRNLGKKLAEEYGITEKAGTAAASVAVKRIIDNFLMPELRRYKSGIYYRCTHEFFGDTKINKFKLVVDKYMSEDNGYETAPYIMHRIGLTSLMSNKRIIATNVTKEARTIKELGVTIRPPKTKITADNKCYLQMLDVIESIGKIPIDCDDPYRIVAKYINNNGFDYRRLLALAYNFYSKETVKNLAKTAVTDVAEKK